MAGYSGPPRVSPGHWLLSMGFLSVFGLGGASLLGATDLLKVLQVIVLGQAFLISLGLLFLVVVDAVAGSEVDREAAARRAMWFTPPVSRSEIWDHAVQSHLQQIWSEGTPISEGIGSTPSNITFPISIEGSQDDTRNLRRAPGGGRIRRAA